MNEQSFSLIRTSSGTVLLLAMVFMLMLALVTTTVLQTAILQLRMAGNNQFLEEAFHKAQAVTAELSQSAENFPLELQVGHSSCPTDSLSAVCGSLLLPVSAAVSEDVEIDYRVTRQAPLLWKSFPIRESQSIASGSGTFTAAIFEIDVHVDGSAKRLGVSRIVQGVAVRVAGFQ